MKIRLLLATAALALAPGFALAEGCGWEMRTKTSSQCAAGQTWDEATQSCATVVQS